MSLHPTRCAAHRSAPPLQTAVFNTHSPTKPKRTVVVYRAQRNIANGPRRHSGATHAHQDAALHQCASGAAVATPRRGRARSIFDTEAVRGDQPDRLSGRAVSPFSHFHARRECLGFVHRRSGTIFCRPRAKTLSLQFAFSPLHACVFAATTAVAASTAVAATAASVATSAIAAARLAVGAFPSATLSAISATLRLRSWVTGRANTVAPRDATGLWGVTSCRS